MGIFMDSIDFNECLKKKKELEKEAESTAPEEVREEKVEEKKERNKQSLFLDGREFCILWYRELRSRVPDAGGVSYSHIYSGSESGKAGEVSRTRPITFRPTDN